jgi:hypothetical protein
LATLRKVPGLGLLIHNAEQGDQLLGERIRLFPPGGATLLSLIPQFGILEKLVEAGEPISFSCLPTRENASPTRTEVFRHLRYLTEEDGNLLLADEPAWLSSMASWYNAAYNGTIARKNGCTAYEMLWPGPLGSLIPGASMSITRVQLNLIELASIPSDRWSEERAQCVERFSRWRHGQITLSEALMSVPSASKLKTKPVTLGASRPVKSRMASALEGEPLVISEIYNKQPDPHSPERAILFQLASRQNGDELLSSTFIVRQIGVPPT